jgi:hypothetical protein
VRAEHAHEHWSQLPPSKRRLAVGRAKAADAFNGIMTARWLAKDLSATNVAIAEHHLDIDEKQVRQWRENEKPLPLGAVYEMPASIALELLQHATMAVRGGGHTPGARGALGALADATATLKRTRIADADVDDTRSVLRTVARDLAQLLASLEAP